MYNIYMDLEQEIDVTVIIINYKTCSLTLDCIRSVFEKTANIHFEIIVVDNASGDECVAVLNEAFPAVKVIEPNTNLGFGKANNLAASHAKGRYLFFLNSDTVLLNNAIEALFSCLQSDVGKTMGICGPNLFTKELRAHHSYATSYPSLLNIFLYRSRLSKFFRKTDVFNVTGKIKDVAIIIGAALFIPARVFEELEGFDPVFFMYVEDGDLSYRAKAMGYRIVSVPNAKIIHYQGKSSSTGSKLIMEVTSYIYYFKKHTQFKTVRIYKLIEFFFASIKFILFSLWKKETTDCLPGLT
ncbi:MAG: glycosyltransferase family 2 protein [Ferruginibacter sp.]